MSNVNNDPYKLLANHCIDIGLSKYFNGELSFDNACDLICKMIDDYSLSDEFNQKVKDYYSQFVDVKSLALGDPVIIEDKIEQLSSASLRGESHEIK